MTPRDVRYGDGAILQVPAVVADLRGRSVLLVCGRSSFEASGASRMLPDLERVAKVRRWSDFAPNTDAVDLLRGLTIVEEFGPDVIVGVGGGSAMDMAKLLCAYQNITDAGKLHDSIRAGDRITSREPHLVLAPTTSGTGSEATHFAVVYIGDDKFSIGGPVLRPDVAILDPALTLSGTPYQRATSGIDAVSQAIESLWAVGATDESRRHARAALRMLMPAIEAFVNAPTNDSARAMAIGSHLAGRAIDISKTTVAHALSYAITKEYGVSHGHAVALTLPAFIEHHATAKPTDLQSSVDPAHHAAALRSVFQALDAPDGAQASQNFVDLGRRLGLPMQLTRVGISTEPQIEALASRVNVERLGNNPMRFTKEGLVQLLSTS
ncbi:MAG: iron-containing alcohol dehydrogenase [Propionibacteriales bacterium]|nr:iron-containing alcohol dehydrogenase [Propionibacteriales bacterium]